MYYQSQNYYLVPLTAEEMEMLKNSREKKNSLVPETRATKKEYQLSEPGDALKMGNIFQDEYRGYKDYKPEMKKPADERESMMLSIMIFSNAAHDIGLKLDIYPDDKELITKFNEYAEKANGAIKDYQAKYGPLSPSAATDSTSKFTWIKTPSDWIR